MRWGGERLCGRADDRPRAQVRTDVWGGRDARTRACTRTRMHNTTPQHTHTRARTALAA